MTYEAVRAMLFYGLPERRQGQPFSEAERNREVERLVAIGRFELEHWAFQKAAADERRDASPSSVPLTYGHVRIIQQDAAVLLADYLDRKRPVLDAEAVRMQMNDLRESLKSDIAPLLPPIREHMRPPWMRWILNEAMAGPVAALGVILVAVVAHLVFPVYMEAAAIELGKFFGFGTNSATQEPAHPAATH